LNSIEWKWDLGSIAHLVYGLLAVAFDQLWLFSMFFVILQVMDWIDGELTDETDRDCAEFILGLIIGLTLSHCYHWFHP